MFRWCLALSFAYLACVASAQQDPADYRALVSDAIAAQESGHYAEARELFLRADALAPSARTARGVGVCAFQAGDFVTAVLYLERSRTHPNNPLGDELRAAVTELLARASLHVGRVHLDVVPKDARVTVDQVSRQERDLVLLPGRHVLVLDADGYLPQTIELDVTSGTERLRIALAAIPPLDPNGSSSTPPDSPGLRVGSAARGSGSSKTASESQPRGAPRLQPLPVRTRRLNVAMWAMVASTGALVVASAAIELTGQLRSRRIERACRRGTCTEAYVNQQTDSARLPQLGVALTLTSVAALTAAVTAGSLWGARTWWVDVQHEPDALSVVVRGRF